MDTVTILQYSAKGKIVKNLTLRIAICVETQNFAFNSILEHFVKILLTKIFDILGQNICATYMVIRATD